MQRLGPGRTGHRGERTPSLGVYLKAEVTGFTDRLDVGCEGRSEAHIWGGRGPGPLEGQLLTETPGGAGGVQEGRSCTWAELRSRGLSGLPGRVLGRGPAIAAWRSARGGGRPQTLESPETR